MEAAQLRALRTRLGRGVDRRGPPLAAKAARRAKWQGEHAATCGSAPRSATRACARWPRRAALRAGPAPLLVVTSRRGDRRGLVPRAHRALRRARRPDPRRVRLPARAGLQAAAGLDLGWCEIGDAALGALARRCPAGAPAQRSLLRRHHAAAGCRLLCRGLSSCRSTWAAARASPGPVPRRHRAARAAAAGAAAAGGGARCAAGAAAVPPWRRRRWSHYRRNSSSSSSQHPTETGAVCASVGAAPRHRCVVEPETRRRTALGTEIQRQLLRRARRRLRGSRARRDDAFRAGGCGSNARRTPPLAMAAATQGRVCGDGERKRHSVQRRPPFLAAGLAASLRRRAGPSRGGARTACSPRRAAAARARRGAQLQA